MIVAMIRRLGFGYLWFLALLFAILLPVSVLAGVLGAEHVALPGQQLDGQEKGYLAAQAFNRQYGWLIMLLALGVSAYLSWRGRLPGTQPRLAAPHRPFRIFRAGVVFFIGFLALALTASMLIGAGYGNNTQYFGIIKLGLIAAAAQIVGLDWIEAQRSRPPNKDYARLTLACGMLAFLIQSIGILLVLPRILAAKGTLAGIAPALGGMLLASLGLVALSLLPWLFAIRRQSVQSP
ncbi:hypothetical protein D0B54_00755 [Solimonas sp. K1W22B-7]|uniref:hypothetical protein n=1 Tax=Solimonas sp. K1W22B-7 TaxID=2303331 RepID=UPI000E32FB75|nr:hypothetical protein [Solimonas sp. K1W22B-7]AXQ27306.1 hypothetical protein D0B54_00755 [Solimonas sp. K1W22B-7]